MHAGLEEICSYALFPPGKCFRAALTLQTASALGVAQEELMSFGAAIEIIHAASLVHDDLPALDNDKLRRGRATVHSKYGEASAILAGDALFALAFQVLESAATNKQTGSIRQQLASLLQKTFIDICQGQLLDLQASGVISNSLSRPEMTAADELTLRHSLKTGALIEAAVIGPCYFTDNQPRLQSALSRFAKSLGLLFQITDDILEATSEAGKLGKDVDSDLRKGTPTYVSVHGLAKAQQLAIEVADEGRRALESQPQLLGLVDCIEYVLHRAS